MTKNIKDPYPIKDVYHVTSSLIDAATVVVTDLCENLSNSIDTYDDDILNSLKKINTSKYNSISVGNGADGIYPIWAGVDANNKVKKIFVSINTSNYNYDNEKTQKLVSWSWNKTDLNDQFFSKKSKSKRKKIFDMEIKSNAIAIADHSGNFTYDHHEHIIESLNEKYFKNKDVYQNNYPIGLFIFKYGHENQSDPSSNRNLKTLDKKVVNINDYKKYKYIEFLSRLLDETCYPTKYIFGKYLIERHDDEGKIELEFIDKKISSDYLLKRLPKALQILKKQNKILFAKNFKEVHEIRKLQFENFIYGIIKDIEPQELDLPTYRKIQIKRKQTENKLSITTPGLAYIQETFYDGYKLKSEPSLSASSTIPVKNGKYPCYVHTVVQKDEADDFEWESVYVVLEGIEDCYLNRNSKGQLFFDKKLRESLFLKDQIKKKSKKISIDKVCLRNSEKLDELTKLTFVEDLELHGFNSIKDWSGLTKLKKLKKLKLISCEVDQKTSINFFKNLYSLANLEEFIIDDSSSIARVYSDQFPKNIYFKKLKSFSIDFRKDWKKTEHKDFPKHKGYGDEGLWFLSSSLPNIHQFPNYEKFKSLEKLNFYNLFDRDEQEGLLFSYDYDFYYNVKKIHELCKNSKIKDIWIYGYHFNKANELVGTKFLDLILELIEDTNIQVNGVSKDKLKLIHKKPFSEKSSNIKKLLLQYKVEDQDKEKIISRQENNIVLNYFSIIHDERENNLLEDIFNQKLEEIVIDDTFQFLRTEWLYGDFEIFKKHVQKNNNLKKISFVINDKEVKSGYGDISGAWDHYEGSLLAELASTFLIKNKNVKISIQSDSIDEIINDNKKLSIYIKLFEAFRVLNDNLKTKGRYEIFGLDNEKIDEIVEKYLLEVVDTIVVIEDNKEWNDSKEIRNIEFFDQYKNFESGAFTTSLGQKKIEISHKGQKPFAKEGKFLAHMFDHEKFWDFSNDKYYHFLNRNITTLSPDQPIIFVKQKYLDSSNKIIFKNIKHFFYFGIVDYVSDKNYNIKYKKFWKEGDYFKFPQGVKCNNLQTLNISGGRNFQLNNFVKQINCSNLKQLVVTDCIIENRTFPPLPKIENLILEDQYNEKAKPISNFGNIKNLKNLELRGLYNVNENNFRWTTTEFDFSDLKKLKNLNSLRILSLNPKYLTNLKELKNLEELELSLQLITKEMSPDDSTFNKSLIDEQFNFFRNLKKLKKLDLTLLHEPSETKGPVLLSYLNKKIEDLSLAIDFKDENINQAYQTIKYIVKNFKSLKTLNLLMGRQEVFETNDKKKLIYFKKTGEKWSEGDLGPRPFILDLKQFASLKNLERLGFETPFQDEMGFKVINALEIVRMKKITHLHIKDEKFLSKDLIKIRNLTEVPQEKFLEKCKKKDKSITSEYSLSDKDKNKYDRLGKKIKFGGYFFRSWSAKGIKEILKERKTNK